MKRNHNIRLLYQEKTGVEIPKNYDVHHIDFNPLNNDINNLVAIPKTLHNKYHQIIKDVKCLEPIDDVKMMGSLQCNGYIEYHVSIMFNFVRCYKLCRTYIDYRDYLLGKLPYNISGVNYGRE